MEHTGHEEVHEKHHHHDHDHGPEQKVQSNSILNALNPKQTFVLGLVGGFFVLCTIGFFVLLSMYIKGGIPARAAVPSVGNDGLAVDDGGVPANIEVRPIDDKRDHVRGAKNAKVTLVEYSDFECPFCQRFYPSMQQVLEKYGKEVRVVYRHFPLSFHQQALPAAHASECAGEQGKFWEMHDLLFEKGVTTGSYTDYAKQIGINTIKFDACVKEEKYTSRITEDQQDGRNAGVQGTPHTVILGPNGEKIPVSGALPFEAVEAELLKVL